MAITIMSQTESKITFRVTPLTSNQATIIETRVYVDEVLKQKYEVNSKDKTLDFLINKDDYSIGNHNVKIRSEDAIGDYEYAYTTFEVKSPTLESTPLDAALSKITEQLFNTYNYLNYQRKILNANLSSKGVIVSDTDRMSILIDKVANISTATKVIASDNILCKFISTTDTRYSGRMLNAPSEQFKQVASFSGSVRVSTNANRVGSGSTYEIQLLRNGSVVYTTGKLTLSTSIVTYSHDISDVKISDEILILFHASSSLNYAVVYESYLKGDIV